MSITIKFPVTLQYLTENKESVETDGNKIGTCLDNVAKQFPELAKIIFKKDGSLSNLITILINGNDAYPDELTKTVKDGDTVNITPSTGC